MIEQVGNALLCIGRFTKSKRGETGLTVTADWDKWVGTTRTALVTGGPCVEWRNNGDYASALALENVDVEALYVCNMYTADGTVDLQDIGPMGWAVGKAAVEHLDADVSSRLASASYTEPPSAAAIETEVLDALTSAHQVAGSVGKAIADAAAGPADPDEIAAGILDALRAGHVDDDTIGEALDYIYRKLATPGSVSVVSGYFGGVVSIVPGDDYHADHENVIPIPIANAPDVSAASLAFEVDGVTLSPAVVPTVSGEGTSRVANATLSDEHTEQLRGHLPSTTGSVPPSLRVYARVRATWPDGLQQTIGAVELRQPAWGGR